MSCRHELLAAYLDDTHVRCGMCGAQVLTLAEIQHRFGPMVLHVLVGFAVKRAQGSATPVAEYFKTTESPVGGSSSRKRGEAAGRP